MPYETLLFDVQDGVATITLNRPDVYNALNVTMARELAEVALQCSASREVRAVLLGGAGKAFCAGGDLRAFQAAGDELPRYLEEITTALHTAISRLAYLDAPVIALVHGSAAGGGMSLACASDLVLAAESARFTMAYTRIGLSPDGSSSFFLPRLVGMRRALELFLTNRLLSAPEALDWGLVTRVVPDGELQERGRELAAQFAWGSRAAFGATKRLLQHAATASLESQMALETRTIARLAAEGDGREGIAAFLEKREPRFER